jgi:uncharacterized protein
MSDLSPSRAAARAAIYLIELYRNMISPFRPPACRFTPTCSQYAVDALRVHGIVRGTGLAMWRLARCGPWHRGGWDPIPDPRPSADTDADSAHTDAAATLRSDSLV